MVHRSVVLLVLVAAALAPLHAEDDAAPCVDTIHEWITTSNFKLSFDSITHNVSAHDTTFSTRIELITPFVGSSCGARHAAICFFPDGDARLREATFDPTEGYLFLYYPLSMLDPMLDTFERCGQIRCSYTQYTVGTEVHVDARVSGRIP